MALLAPGGHAQTVENKTPLTPETGEHFGSAVTAGPLITPPGGDWLIVSAPHSTVGSTADVGNVECFPVISSMTTPAFSLEPPAGYIQGGMRFGEAIVAADMDGDGITDIVVGVPGYDNGQRIDEGIVFIFYGPWSPRTFPPYAGFSTLVPRTVDLDPNTHHGGEFGFALAVGDLDDRTGSNELDLVVGTPQADDVTQNPVLVAAGAIDIFIDPPKTTLAWQPQQHVYQNASSGAQAAANHYGWAVAIGQFSDKSESNAPDIAVGVPDQDLVIPGNPPQTLTDAGIIQVHFGHGPLGARVWDNTAGYFQETVATLEKLNGRLGTSLAAADYTGDSWDDLAVGAPGQVDSSDNPLGPEGYVMIYNGTATQGLVSPGSAPNDPLIMAALSQQQTSTNLFGFSLVWADTDGQGQLDLVIGGPGAPPLSVGPPRQGVVFIAHPTTGAVPANWTQTQIQDPSPNIDERFGWAVARCSRLGTSLDDVALGVIHADIPGTADTGESFVWNY